MIFEHTEMIVCAIGIIALVGWVMFFRARSLLQGAGVQHQAELAVLAERMRAREEQVNELRGEIARLGAEVEEREELVRRAISVQSELQTRLESERQLAQESVKFVEQAKATLQDAFGKLSNDALKQNNTQFLDLAKQSLATFHETSKGELEKRTQAIDELVKPLKDSLGKVDAKIEELEKTRVANFASMSEQIKGLQVTERELKEEARSLQKETQNLVQALRTPHVRGRWGEVQLRRVVEIAGMTEYCDFQEQVSVTTEEGRSRPDLLVKLPNGKLIVVDSKVSLSAYLQSLEAPDEDSRRSKLIDHARQVKTHVTQLGGKNYFREFETSAELSVLFMPGENLLSSALERDPELLEYAASRGVMLTTPMTLIALLRAVAYGWQQEQIAKNAIEISKQGKQLFERLGKFASHLSALGTSLNRSVESYNKAIGSLEQNLIPAARRMKELGATTADDIETTLIETSIRSVQAITVRSEGIGSDNDDELGVGGERQ